MWLFSHWIPITREILYGIGFVLFVTLVVLIIVKTRRKKEELTGSRVFKGKNLERANVGKFLTKKSEKDYEDLPIVDLKWQKGKGNKNKKSSAVASEEEDDDEEVDDGYADLTVVEKTIAEKAKQLQFTNPKKQSTVSKKTSAPVRKDATGDKIDFFTQGKNAL